MTKQTKQYTIGIDIGGTNMKAVLFDGENVIADYLLATPKDSLDHFLIMLNALIEPLHEKAKQDKKKIAGIGVGVPGVVDSLERKITAATPNLLLLDNIKLGKILEDKTGIPVFLDNDTNCFLLAEVKNGIAKKYTNVFGLIIGTGIGGAWWINDSIYKGAYRGAGEPGRMICNFSDPIELEEVYKKITQNNAGNLAEEAYRGDVLAQKSFEEFGCFLGIALANITNLIDPQVFVIGGGASESSDLFLPKTKKCMREYIMNPESKKVKILKSKLGGLAGAIGAALLVEG